MMQLPYGADDLGVISGNTLGFHHGKHLKAYVDNVTPWVSITASI